MVQIRLRKAYLSMEELMARWDWTIYDLQYVTENGDMKVYVRPIALEAAFMPLFLHNKAEQLKKCPLSPIEIHRLFCADKSSVTVSRFHNMQLDTGIQITFADLIILTEDIEEYEKHNSCDFVLLSPDYREFILRGEKIRMGNKQALIIKHLYEQAQTDNPWVHGKDLMKIAGSDSWKIQNLFGRNKKWRSAIISDGRGYYKFNA